MRRLLFRLSAVLLVLVLGAAAACSSDDDGDGDEGASTEASAEGTTDDSVADEGPETVRVLVSNDDGVDGEGLAVLVESLSEVEGAELTISAPAENASGSSDTTTLGPVADLGTTETEVAGQPATAVDGYPADAVLRAVEDAPDGAESFDVVISGINEGQNIGSIEQLSGTVGAARTGAREGLPALAVSSGVNDGADISFELAGELAADWLVENREALILDDDGAEPGPLYSLNVPSCPPGETEDLLELDEGGVDVAGRDTIAISCEGGQASDEVDAFIRGYPVLVPLEVG